MLDINIEFSRGVLFVRLIGKLTKNQEDNIKENILGILNKSGIKYLVFNINELEIDDDLSLFDECEKLVKKNNGKMFVCGNKLLKYPTVINELNALRLIESC